MILFGLIWVSLVVLSAIGVLIVLRSEFRPLRLRRMLTCSEPWTIPAGHQVEVRCASPPLEAQRPVSGYLACSGLSLLRLCRITGDNCPSALPRRGLLRPAIGLLPADAVFCPQVGSISRPARYLALLC
jgi:hypothetical protein